MKKFIALAAAALLVMPVAGKDKDKEKKADKDSLIFTTIVENPVTSIKNQNSSGTCWAYSSLAFLESEAIKKNPALKEDLDLCESFLVSKTYVDRADKHVRTHGDASFSQGGSFEDALYCMEHYGFIPEGIMPYPFTEYGDSLFYHEGAGTFHFSGSHGEDSIVTFILHVIPSSDTTICDSITEDQLPWFAMDTVFNDTVADYTVHTYNEAGCDSLIHYSLFIFWNGDHCDTALTYPNVVTPNGDGVNDRFVIGGLIEHNCFKYSELTIYDRYGHCVYHKRNIANESDWWNPAAQRAPSGTYFYYLA